VRAADGTITPIDAPGAQGTFANAINPAGTITGYYTDASFASHGFVRATDGTITTFDGPGAGTSFFQGTNPGTINPAGAIAGYYTDAGYISHGFVRAKGTVTSFDPPGSVNTIGFAFNNQVPVGINPAGEITGSYIDASFASHGFLRSAKGSFTSFDPPGSISTQPSSINQSRGDHGKLLYPR